MLALALAGLALGVARLPRAVASETTQLAVPMQRAAFAPARLTDVEAAVLRSARGASFALDAPALTHPTRGPAGPPRAGRDLDALALTSSAPPVALSEPPLAALGLLSALGGRAIACLRRLG